MKFVLPNYDQVLYMLEDLTEAVAEYVQSSTDEERREAMKALMEIYEEAVLVLPKG